MHFFTIYKVQFIKGPRKILFHWNFLYNPGVAAHFSRVACAAVGRYTLNNSKLYPLQAHIGNQYLHHNICTLTLSDLVFLRTKIVACIKNKTMSRACIVLRNDRSPFECDECFRTYWLCRNNLTNKKGKIKQSHLYPCLHFNNTVCTGWFVAWFVVRNDINFEKENG